MVSGADREVLLGIRTVAEMVEAFAGEERRRRLVEALVWPKGRVCPTCGYKRSIALAGPLALQEFELFDSDAKRKSAIVRVVEKVAKHLGNTPAICRRCYIHPAVLDGYLDGTLLATLKEQTRAYLTKNIAGMSAEEAAVAAFLGLRLRELEREQKGSGFPQAAVAG